MTATDDYSDPGWDDGYYDDYYDDYDDDACDGPYYDDYYHDSAGPGVDSFLFRVAGAAIAVTAVVLLKIMISGNGAAKGTGSVNYVADAGRAKSAEQRGGRTQRCAGMGEVERSGEEGTTGNAGAA
eukprot:g741.t1